MNDRFNNPYEYLKALFRGEKLTTEDLQQYNPIFINRIISLDPELAVKYLDLVNKQGLTAQQHYYILLGKLKGKGRFIEYLKRTKIETSKVFDKFRERVRQLYQWSDREFSENIWFVPYDSPTFIELCRRVGLEDHENKELSEEMKKENG